MKNQFPLFDDQLSEEVKIQIAALQADEARYRLIFNSMPVGLWEQDFSAVKKAIEELKLKGITDFEAYFNEHPEAVAELANKVQVSQINQAAAKMYSASSPQELYDHLTQYLTREGMQTFQQELVNIAQGQTNFSFETTNYNLQGEIIHIHLYWTVLPGYEQTFERVLVLTQDITSQKAADIAIRESEQRYRNLFEFIQEGFALHEIILDDNGKPCDYRFLEINPAFEELTGLKREQLIGKTVLEVLPQLEPYWIETYGQVALSGKPTTIANYSKELGKYYLVRAYSPAPRHFATLFNDITQLKLIEKELREKEAWLEQALDAGNIGIYSWDIPSGKRTTDQRWAAMLGYSPDEAQQIDIISMKNSIHPDDQPQVNQLLQDYIAGNISSHQMEYRLRTKNGAWKWILSSGKVVERDPEGKPLRVLGVAIDINERKKTEQARIASEAHFRAIFNAAAEMIFVVDQHRIIYEVNPAACTALGYNKNELIGTTLCALVHPNHSDCLIEHLAELEPTKGVIIPEILMHTKAGNEILLEATISPYTIIEENFILFVMRDITERKRLQETMMQTEKMASLGMMAAGVAHEINNPMQVITGVCQSLLARLDKGEVQVEDLQRYLQMLERNAWRVVDIVKSLNIYAHVDDIHLEPINLNEVVHETLLLFEPQLKKLSHIEFFTELCENLPPIAANKGQLGQVILNLLTNARDAIEENGTIHIRTYTAPHKLLTVSGEESQVIEMVCLEVADSGKGIPYELQSKIFDPFFTTKPVGVGTGLGLAIIKGIIKSHNGDITFTSHPAQGTTFQVFFPPISAG